MDKKFNLFCSHSTAAKLFFFKFKEFAHCTKAVITIFSSGGFPISSLVNKPDGKLLNSTPVRALDAQNFVKKFETANYASELGKVSVIHSKKIAQNKLSDEINRFLKAIAIY